VLYDIQIKSVIPKSAREQLDHFPRCYLGVSLEQEAFEDDRLSGMLDWIASRADACRILIGGELHRINLMIWDGLSKEDALKKARKLGKEFEGRCRLLIHKYLEGLFSMAHWSGLTIHEKFPKYLNELQILARDNKDFSKTIEKTAEGYLMRQIQHGRILRCSHVEALQFSREYIFEEIAVFAVLASEGWSVDIYPGPELPILVEIAQGKYEKAPEPLMCRINIELAVRPVETLSKAH
jgi:tRNA-dependent cyclodipeptide synthase